MATRQIGSVQIVIENDPTKEYHELSSVTQVTVDKHKEARRRIELEQLAQSVPVPTNDDQVKLRLRLIGQPICFFGETLAARRQRLKGFLAEMAIDGTLDAFNKQFEQKEIRPVPSQNSQNQPFLAESANPEEVWQLRASTFDVSMARAKYRMEYELMWRIQMGNGLNHDGIYDALLQQAYITHKQRKESTTPQDPDRSGHTPSGHGIESDGKSSTHPDHPTTAVVSPLHHIIPFHSNIPSEIHQEIASLDPTQKEEISFEYYFHNRKQYTQHHYQSAQYYQHLAPLETHKADARVVSCADLYQGQLMTGSWSSYLKLWDLNQSQTPRDHSRPQAILVGHKGRVIDCVFMKESKHYPSSKTPSQNGILALSSGVDGICIWPKFQLEIESSSRNNDGDDDNDNDGDETMGDDYDQLSRYTQSSRRQTGPTVYHEESSEDNDDQTEQRTKHDTMDDHDQIKAEDRDGLPGGSSHDNTTHTSYQQEAKILSTATKLRPLYKITTHSERVNRIAVCPHDRYVISTSHDCTTQVHDLETGTTVLVQPGYTRPTYGLGIHQDGSLFCAGDLGGNARVWDIRTGRSVVALTEHSHQVLACDFGVWNTSHLLATGSGDNTIKLWDLRTLKCMYTIPTHMRQILDVKFNQTGEFLASAGYDSRVNIFSIPTMTHLTSLAGHTSKVTRVCWHEAPTPLGAVAASTSLPRELYPSRGHERQLVSTSFDQSFKIWGHLPT